MVETMEGPSAPGPQDSLKVSLTKIPELDAKYAKIKEELQAISRQWESKIPEMVEAHEERKAWRRLERKSMKAMGLKTEMLPASDTEDEMILEMVSRAKQVRPIEEEEEKNKEVGSELEEASSSEATVVEDDDDYSDLDRLSRFDRKVTLRFLKTPVLQDLPYAMAAERLYRLLRRRERHQEHQPPKVTPSASSSSKRSRPVSPPDPKEKTKKLAAPSSSSRAPKRPGLVTRASRSSHPAPSQGAYVS